MDDDYLIWSHEHSAWWLRDGIGYTTHLDLAGRYTREAALAICTRAMPGAHLVLSELPVRAADMQLLCDRYAGQYGPDVPWR